MKSAVIYARYSSYGQQEQSIDGQVRACKEYAKRNDYLIIKEYIDRAKSGTNDNRPAFQEMLNDSQNKSFGTILVYQYDRFARNRRESLNNEFILQKNGVNLISVTEQLNENEATSVIIKGMYECIAEYYSKDLSKKVRRGIKESLFAKKTIGGYKLFGYSTDPNKKIVVAEDEASIVCKIFELRLSGKTVKEIAEWINTLGYKNHGKEFNGHSIRLILSNNKYRGIYRNPFDRSEIINDYYPRIIDDNLFESVQRTFRNYGSHPRKRNEQHYLLTGKVFSGFTGSIMSGYAGTGRSKVYHYYCDKKSNFKIGKEFLEEQIIKTLQTILKNEECLTYLAKIVKNNIKKRSKNDDNKQLFIHERMIIKQLEKIESSFVDAPEGSDIRKRLVISYENCSKQLEIIKNDIAKIQMLKNKTIQSIDNIKDYLSKKITSIETEEDRTKFINVFLSTAFVESDIIYIYLNIDNEGVIPFKQYRTDLDEINAGKTVRVTTDLVRQEGAKTNFCFVSNVRIGICLSY